MLVDDLVAAEYDRATAQTLMDMAESQSIPEAQTFLTGILGEKNSIVKKYIDRRQALDLETLNKKNPKIYLKKEKPKQAKYISKFSAEDKSKAIKDLDGAISNLNLAETNRVKCDCLGLKHGLAEQAPNCLYCGRIVCKKEGLGNCLTCDHPLVTGSTLETLKQVLLEQKQGILATMSKKALAAAGIDPSMKEDLAKLFKSNEEAEKHLEKTLNFQAHDAERTRIIDQVGEVDVITEGVNQWSTPEEQARQMVENQRKLRILQEKEKQRRGLGRKVLSIDIQGNKVYQREEDAPIEVDMEDLEEEPPANINMEDIESTPFYDDKLNKKQNLPKYKAEKSNDSPAFDIPEVPIVRSQDELFMY